MGIAPHIVMKWTGHSDYSAMKPYIDVADSVRMNEMQNFNQGYTDSDQGAESDGDKKRRQKHPIITNQT